MFVHDCATFYGNSFIFILPVYLRYVLLKPNYMHSGSTIKIPKYNQGNTNPNKTSSIFLTTMKTLLIKKQYFEYCVSDSQKS